MMHVIWKDRGMGVINAWQVRAENYDQTIQLYIKAFQEGKSNISDIM